MKVTVHQSALNRALRLCQHAVGTGVLPITKCVKLETVDGRLRATTTDLQVSVETSVAAKIDTEGAVCVPLRELVTAIAALPATDIEIDGDKRRVNVRTGKRFEATYEAMDAEDWPRIPKPDDTATTVENLDAATLTGALHRCLHATGNESYARPILEGVHIGEHNGQIEAAACDGNRLYVAPLDMPNLADLLNPDAKYDSGFVVHRRVIGLLDRAFKDTADVELKVSRIEAVIRFESADTAVSGLLVQGAYPNYRQLVPDMSEATTWTGPASEIEQAGRIARGIREGGEYLISKIFLSAGSLHIVARREGDRTNYVIEGAQEGDDARVALDTRLLVDAASVVDGHITIHTTNKSSPVMFTNSDNDELEMVMPMFVEFADSDRPDFGSLMDSIADEEAGAGEGEPQTVEEPEEAGVPS